MRDLKGKVAVVTGAASGIGRAMAERFAREGMKIVLADVEAAPLTHAREEIGRGGVEAIAVQTDVSQWEQVERLAKRLPEDEWQFKSVGMKKGVWAKAGKDEWRTRLHKGACVFLNRTDFDAGPGCALVDARGRPRFCIACDRPWAMTSADSDRYHCRWQASRERSSSTPNRIGVRHSPRGVSTLREPWWQSQCQSMRCSAYCGVCKVPDYAEPEMEGDVQALDFQGVMTAEM